MTQQATSPVPVSPEFAAAIPAEPQSNQQVSSLTALAPTTDTRKQLVCKDLLVGETLVQAQAEATDVLPEMLDNTQVATVFGLDALKAVNDLNDKMLRGRPPVDIPELDDLMKNLSRHMRGLGKRYDPSDPKVLAKYEKFKGGILARFHLAKTFFEEFLDDIRSLQDRFERVIETLEGKQTQLLRNVGYYDVSYELNEQEIDRLIYVIGVMELIRDLAVEKAKAIPVGDPSLGDRGGEEKAQISELVTFLENKIIAFKSRLWVAWAMAPQIRNMRSISVGLSARLDQTIGITIPTMKNVVVIWLTLSEAQQAEQFNQAVEDAFNQSLQMFATAARVVVPKIAAANATPALDPRTVIAWSESLAAQTDGIVETIKLGKQKRAELEDALISAKQVMDASTQKVNEARLEYVLEAAQEAHLEIAKSVPSAQN